MAFNDGPGFTQSPGMYYPAYRFNMTGGFGETAWSGYLVVSNYSGSVVSNTDILGAVKDALIALPDVSSVQVTEYRQETEDVTGTL